MLKITGIPIWYQPFIMKFVRDNNKDNLFYVWPGKLSQSINEILILISLETLSGETISDLFNRRTKLKELYSRIGNEEFWDPRIIQLLELLCGVNAASDDIWIEPPFRFEPHIKLLGNELPRISGKPVIPIGDSFFCGHAKVGNGLGHHLPYVRRLAAAIIEGSQTQAR